MREAQGRIHDGRPKWVVPVFVLILIAAPVLCPVPLRTFAHHSADSLLRLAAGLVGALVCAALVVVVFAGRIRESRALLSSLTFLDAIPTLAWIPLFLVVASGDEATILAAVTLGGALPLTIATVRGISQVDRHLELSARLLGASGVALWVVLLQASRPTIVTGLRSCVYQAARTVIGAEILTTADFGLGRLATYARQASNVEAVIGVAAVIGSAVALLDALVLQRIQHETEKKWTTRIGAS